MGLLKGDIQNPVLHARETPSDISIGDQIEVQHSFNYDQAKAASYLVSPNRPGSPSTVLEPNLLRSSASYILMRSDNLETNVDSWIESCDNDPTRRRENVSVQQPSVADGCGALGPLWYMLALLPAISVQRRGWCSPSNSITAILNMVDLFSAYLKQIISNVRTKISRLAIDQILHEFFVVAMDFALALHAFIFLALAVYQDSA